MEVEIKQIEFRKKKNCKFCKQLLSNFIILSTTGDTHQCLRIVTSIRTEKDLNCKI